MTVSSVAWYPTAAYLYVLELDELGLAWEYLRRNPSYRKYWHQRTCGAGVPAPVHWGCAFAEDPDLDARDANPSWLPQPAKVVSLIQRSPSDSVGQPFCLWRMAGRKALMMEDADILLTVHQGQRMWRYALSPDLSDGEWYAFSVPCDAQTRHRLDAVNDAILAMEQGTTGSGQCRRASRASLVHWRCLQALDGAAAGASQREIAEALFGVEAVAERWTPDGELRAQVRHLLRRGHRYVNGDYRSLIDAS